MSTTGVAMSLRFYSVTCGAYVWNDVDAVVVDVVDVVVDDIDNFDI
jgi:hypothetical protein